MTLRLQRKKETSVHRGAGRLGGSSDGIAYKKLLEPVSEFCKVSGCEINMQNSNAFLCGSNKTLEIDLRTNASEGQRHLKYETLRDACALTRWKPTERSLSPTGN